MAEYRRFGWCFCGIVFCDSSQLCSLLGQARRAPRVIWGSPGRAVNVLATRWDKEECFSHIISGHVHFKNSFPLLLHVLSLELSLARLLWRRPRAVSHKGRLLPSWGRRLVSAPMPRSVQQVTGRKSPLTVNPEAPPCLWQAWCSLRCFFPVHSQLEISKGFAYLQCSFFFFFFVCVF